MYLKLFTLGFLGSFVFYLVATNIGQAHGLIAPVVSKAHIYDPRPSPPPDYRTQWSADAEKLRNCDFHSIEWFLGLRSGHKVEVVAEFLDMPQVRGVGTLVWTSLMISLPPEDTLENSHADVLHDCGMPWLVRSKFYN